MILYLAAVSVVNLALGFVLAVYLLRQNAMPRRFVPLTLAAAHPAASNFAAPAPKPETPLTVASEPAPPQEMSELPKSEAVSPAPIETEAASDAPATETADGEQAPPEVEEDVLAGIEAFRAQLAQMKDEPVAAE